MNTWDELPKNQIDPELVEQAIDRIVSNHNDDPDAHLGDNQALQSHRASEIIDHLAQSVLNDKLHIPARAYTAVVGAGTLVDYNDLQSAIDFVASVGGGSIYITSGTYSLPNILTIPTNIQIYGQSRETVFLDCAPISSSGGNAYFHSDNLSGANASFTNGSNQVVGVGTHFLTDCLQNGSEIYNSNSDWGGIILSVQDDTHLTLTANFSHANQSGAWYAYAYGSGTSVITGVGTHWLSAGLQKGNLIRLDADVYYYEILSIDSDTQITLTDPYEETGGYGATTLKIVPFLQAGQDLPVYSTGTISVTKDSKTVTGSGSLFSTHAVAGQTILINGVPYIIYSVNSNTSLTLVDYYRGRSDSALYYQILSFIENITLQDFNIQNCQNGGAVNFRCVSNSLIENVEIHKCDDGFYLNYCNNVTVQRCDSSLNMFQSGASGMWLIMSTRCHILYNNFSGNYFMGIATQSANFFCDFICNTCNNNGSGGLTLNALGSVGFGNTVTGNKCIGNVSNGIGIDNMDYITISQNVCSQNGSSGISMGKCNFAIIKGNQCFKNTVDGIYTNNNSYGNQVNRSIFAENVCYNNTSIGILIATGGLNNIVVNNIIYSNGTNFTNSGTGTVSANNVTS
jgi:hypothetical protein